MARYLRTDLLILVLVSLLYVSSNTVRYHRDLSHSKRSEGIKFEYQRLKSLEKSSSSGNIKDQGKIKTFFVDEFAQSNQNTTIVYATVEDAFVQTELSYWSKVAEKCTSLDYIKHSSSVKLSKEDPTRDFRFPMNVRLLGYSSTATATTAYHTVKDINDKEQTTLKFALLSFDILGPTKFSYGNWWSVWVYNTNDKKMSNSSSDINKASFSFEAAARVVDHWDGSYTVYLQVPLVHNSENSAESERADVTYTVDVVLDSEACQGFPSSTTNLQHTQYKGYLAMQATITASPQALSDNMSINSGDDVADAVDDVTLFLCDTGYYMNGKWTPGKVLPKQRNDTAKHRLLLLKNAAVTTSNTSTGITRSEGGGVVTHHVGNKSKALVHTKESVEEAERVGAKRRVHVLFLGDSTSAQIDRCLFLRTWDCSGATQCNNIKNIIHKCEVAMNHSLYKTRWQRSVLDYLGHPDPFTAIMGNHRMDQAVRNQVFFSKRIHLGLLPTQKLYTVVNAGVHLMGQSWTDQIQYFQSTLDTLCKCHSTSTCAPAAESISLLNGPHKYNEKLPYYFIYRGTWAIHEYSYFPNPYWPMSKESSYHSQTSVENMRIGHMRDSTSWLQHSFIADYFWNNPDACGGNQHKQASSRRDIWAIATYQNHYWLSKAHRKKISDHDIRHHDNQVVTASIELLLQQMND